VAEFSGDSEFSQLAVTPDDSTIVVADESGQLHFLRLEAVGQDG
jgi:hypothetical protein